MFPSEERKLEMYPMDFEEILWAIGDEITNNLLKIAFQKIISLGNNQNRNIMRKFRLYMLVGGMPQAIKSYVGISNGGSSTNSRISTSYQCVSI